MAVQSGASRVHAPAMVEQLGNEKELDMVMYNSALRGKG